MTDARHTCLLIAEISCDAVNRPEMTTRNFSSSFCSNCGSRIAIAPGSIVTTDTWPLRKVCFPPLSTVIRVQTEVIIVILFSMYVESCSSDGRNPMSNPFAIENFGGLSLEDDILALQPLKKPVHSLWLVLLHLVLLLF